MQEHIMAATTEVGFFRLSQVLEIIPVKKTAWYEGIKTLKYPAQVRLSARSVGWRKSDIFALVEKLGGGQ